MALLDEISSYLVSQGVGVAGSTADWTVKKGFEPPAPDKCLVLYETGGFPNEVHSAATIDRPTFQLRARGSSFAYSTARAKLAAARSALESVGAQTVGGRYYVQITAEGEALALGTDANDRPTVAMNFRALRSRTS